MELDAFLLARIQFGFTVSFHIIFPAITIGLASYLVVLEGRWLRTKKVDRCYALLCVYGASGIVRSGRHAFRCKRVQRLLGVMQYSHAGFTMCWPRCLARAAPGVNHIKLLCPQ